VSRRQLSLVSTWQKDRFSFGGSLLKKSHAKTKRPFSRKLAIHVVLRSTKAVGGQSLLRQGRRVDEALFEEASRQSVKIHAAANAGNHLHLLVQAPSREHLSAFLRAVSGRIAMIATGARKGSPILGNPGRGTAINTCVDPAQAHAIKTPSKASSKARSNIPSKISFWDQRPFTRLVSLGKEFTNVLGYIALNSTEAAGFSRNLSRAMFKEIRERIGRGELARSPHLAAAGFV